MHATSALSDLLPASQARVEVGGGTDTCLTPALHLPYTCFTPASLHLLYTCFTPALHPMQVHVEVRGGQNVVSVDEEPSKV